MFDFLDNIVESLTGKIMGRQQQPSYSNQLEQKNSAVIAALRRQEQEKEMAARYLTDPNNVEERQAIQRELSDMDLKSAYRQRGISALIHNPDVQTTIKPTVKPAPFVNQAMVQQVAGTQTQRVPIQMARYGQTGDMYISNAKEALGLSNSESYLFGSESGFRPEALNKDSEGAFGLGQMIKSQRDKYGKLLGFDPQTTNPHEQVQMARAYIADRYGDAETAEKFRKVTMKELPISVLPEVSSTGFPLKASALTYLKNNWRGY